MKRVVACVRDLIFASRIQETLAAAGWNVTLAEELGSLEQALSAADAAVVLLDLDTAAAADVVALCRSRGLPVLAFGPHTRADLLRGARKAGCALVVPRSSFFSEMAALVGKAARRPAAESAGGHLEPADERERP